MNALSLDLSDERFAALKECPDGEQATVTVSGAVSRAKDGTFTLAVESVELVEKDYEEGEGEVEKVEEEVVAPKAPKKGGPDHPAVMLLVAKKK